MNFSLYGPSPFVKKKLESDSTGCTSIGIFHRFDSSLLNVLNSIQKFQFTYECLKHFLHPTIIERSRITSSVSTSKIYILSCIQRPPILFDKYNLPNHKALYGING